MGDWMQIDCDLPEKREVVNIVCHSGVDLDCTLGRLLRFWRWVERHFNGPTMESANVRTVSALCGGDENFWKAVEKEEWILFGENSVTIPGYKKRFSKSAKRRALDARRKSAVRRQDADTKRTPSGARRDEMRGDEKRKELETPFPPLLSTNEFRESWTAWEAHRKEIKKPLTPTQRQGQLRMLEGIGLQRAIGMIRHTITKGWQGLREEEANVHSPATQTKSAADRAREFVK